MCVSHLSLGAVNVSYAVAQLESPDYTVHFAFPGLVLLRLLLSVCFQLVRVTYRNSPYSAGKAAESKGECITATLPSHLTQPGALCHLLPEISVF